MYVVKLFILQYLHVVSPIFRAKSNGSIFKFHRINLREQVDKLNWNKEALIMYAVKLFKMQYFNLVSLIV